MARMAKGEKLSFGLPLGLGLDKATLAPTGQPKGMVTTVCGVSGMGKSTVVHNIIDKQTELGHEGVVFSLEDGAELYRQKKLARLSGVPLTNIVVRDLSKEDLKKLADISEAAAEAAGRVHLLDAAGLSSAQVIEKYRRLRDVHPGIEWVWVDYLQVLKDIFDKEERVGIRKAMLNFQHAAKQDDICLGVVSQMGREMIKNQRDPRPKEEYLYGSGAISEYSKLILGVHYPAHWYDAKPINGRHYATGTEPPTKVEWEKLIEIWILKQVKGNANIYSKQEWTRYNGRILDK